MGIIIFDISNTILKVNRDRDICMINFDRETLFQKVEVCFSISVEGNVIHLQLQSQEFVLLALWISVCV